jgi:threonylcarbamoyladenosine tRNA methylthiotransferase MtaB
MSTCSIAQRHRQVKHERPEPDEIGPIDRFAGHQRAFVKIQDGCDAFCSYCIVPYTRPRVHSRDESVILTECRDLVAAGHREIVLCGVFLGAYGRATTRRDRWGPGPSPLPGLLERVARIDGLWRVRLSSLEPGDLTDELLAVYRAAPTVAPHLHLPLQSGSDRILRAMNRQYTRRQFLRAVEAARDCLDAPAVTADVIVGFPGETEQDFRQTLAVAEAAGLSKIHAFAFSPIAPTAAWKRRAEAPEPAIVKDRLARLGELEDRLARAYRQQFVGRTVEVLVEAPSRSESRHRSASRHGLSDRYLTVRFPPPCGADLAAITGRILPVRIHRVTDEGLAGTVQADM